MEKENLTRLTVLGHEGRMGIFRLLMRRFPDAVPAGEISSALGLKASTASVYLSALMGAGLIARERLGTQLNYRVNMNAARALSEFLFLDCCRGRPELCPPYLSSPLTKVRTMADDKYNVLFICTGNSARSIFAESILRNEAGDRFAAYSAGSKPFSELNPFAVEMLEQKGHDTAPLHSKNIREFQGAEAPEFDFVFTVCDLAANEECPAWSGQPITAHWGVKDPVKTEGTDAEKRLSFQHAYGALRNRITAFSALPIDTLDRVSLQKAVDELPNIEDAE
ncbi:MAG: ArsR family transcriptional regulator [Pseudomonadota bacterium]